jgi:hypothetical protein
MLLLSAIFGLGFALLSAAFRNWKLTYEIEELEDTVETLRQELGDLYQHQPVSSTAIQQERR